MRLLLGRHSPRRATFACYTGSHEWCQDWPLEMTRCECPCHTKEEG